MAKVDVVRDPTPPIQEVVLTLNLTEALAVAGLLGQFGGEYVHTGELYRQLTRAVGAHSSGDACVRAQYTRFSEEAFAAITTRHKHNNPGRFS